MTKRSGTAKPILLRNCPQKNVSTGGMAESLFFQVEFCDGCSPVYKRIDLGSLFNGQPDTVEFNIDEAPGAV